MAEDRFDRGDRGGRDDRPRRFVSSGPGRSFSRRKVCAFCVDGIKHVDYKDIPRLRRFVSDRGMIEPRRKTGNCAKHQRSLTTAIKRARHLALLSFTEGMREPRDRGGRGDRGPRFRDRDRGPREEFRGGPRDDFRGGPREDFRGPRDDFRGPREGAPQGDRSGAE